MILSDQTIRDDIESGKIQILPEFDLADIRPAGVRLHLGSEFLLPVEGQTVDLDADAEVLFDQISLLNDSFLLKPGQFILGSTFESIKVPRNIVCHVDGRSTVARIGLAIHCTSGVIDGNFEEARAIVLEIKNQGPFNVVLRHRMPLALLTFAQLTTEIEQAAQRQYKGQIGVVAPNLKFQKT